MWPIFSFIEKRILATNSGCTVWFYFDVKIYLFCSLPADGKFISPLSSNSFCDDLTSWVRSRFWPHLKHVDRGNYISIYYCYSAPVLSSVFPRDFLCPHTNIVFFTHFWHTVLCFCLFSYVWIATTAQRQLLSFLYRMCMVWLLLPSVVPMIMLDNTWTRAACVAKWMCQLKSLSDSVSEKVLLVLHTYVRTNTAWPSPRRCQYDTSDSAHAHCVLTDARRTDNGLKQWS